MMIHSAHLTLAEFVTMLAEEPSHSFCELSKAPSFLSWSKVLFRIL